MTHKVKLYFFAAVFISIAVVSFVFLNPSFYRFTFQGEANQEIDKGSYVLSVSYLEPRHLALQEAGMLGISSASRGFDSLEAKYRTSLHFDLIVSSTNSGSEAKSVTNLAAANEQEYKLKNYLLNFRFQDFIQLETNDTTYLPVLTKAVVMPSKDEVRVRMVFPINASETAFNYTLLFSDPVWNTGTSQFNF